MKRVLVLGDNNAHRSQMAEGYLRFYAENKALYFSAGLQAASNLHPMAIRVMEEDGIDISAQQPKIITTFANESFDFVISLSEAIVELPPMIQAVHFISLPLPNPSQDASVSPDAQLLAFHQCRETIKKQVLIFIGRELIEPALFT
jgi:arsenate reductase